MATDPATRAAIDDIFDDSLFDLDEDPFAEQPPLQDTRDDKPTLSPRSSAKRKAVDGNDKENFGLGLDEEVKIVKKRKPIAKLDEARLLSEPGIPKIRSLIRSRQMGRKLRLKGKGHEFTDAARLLNYYQLWLDNLYPRAKFADALQLVEKAGHTKRMQMMRTEWINEGKPGYLRPESINLDVEVRPDEMPELFGDANKDKDQNLLSEADEQGGTGVHDDSMFIPDQGRDKPDHDDGQAAPEDDELDDLLAMQDNYLGDRTNKETTISVSRPAEDSEGEDDLDALLAEQDSRQTRPAPSAPTHDSARFPSQDREEDELADMDELDAILAEQESRTTPKPTQPHPQTNSRTSASSNAPISSNLLTTDDSQNHSIPADLDDDDEYENNKDDLLSAIQDAETRQADQHLPIHTAADQEHQQRNEKSTETSGAVSLSRTSTPRKRDSQRSGDVLLNDGLLSSSPIPNAEEFS